MFEPEIKKPIRACLEKLGKQQILYIVFSFEMPYFMKYGGHSASVDQMVADIWDEYAPPTKPGREAGPQPYFGQAESQGNVYEPFIPFAKYREEPGAKTIYSVWRLDGSTPEVAEGLVDKALYAEAHGLHGNGYFDTARHAESTPDAGYSAGDWDIFRASEMARRAGFSVTLDDKPTEFGTAPSQLKCENAAIYAGWYSLAHYNDAFTWVPGAIGFHLDSASATNPRSGPSWVAGALQKGITVTSGSVTEPFLEGLVHPDQIFYYLFHGANVGDAVLRSTLWLKWMIINLGDPLYTPFPKGLGPYPSNTPSQEAWFGVSPNTLIGEGKVRARFSLGEKRDQVTPVVFTSDHPELMSLPSNVTLPPAAFGATFEISVKSPEAPLSIVIKIAAGTEKLSNTLNVYPLLAGLSISEPAITSGGAATGTVSILLPAKELGYTIRLSSNQPSVVVPEEVKIPPGQQAASFPITGKSVTSELTATITAKFDGAAKTAQLQLKP
jgi:uncharacterized protein (TIGR03790 family)